MNPKLSSKKPKIFLDASCWIAAAGSPTGGSALIFKLSRAGILQITASKKILQEAERNVKAKMSNEAFTRFYQELGSTEIELIEPTEPEEEAQWQGLVAEKDCHVLAGAYKAQADVLVSLDKRHILTAKVMKGFPIPVKDTSSFLKNLSNAKEEII